MENKKHLDWVFTRQHDPKAIQRQLGKGLLADIFVGENSMISIVHIEPNTIGSMHKHPEEQWGVLLVGECVRLQGGEEVDMKMGDFWYTPPNVLHGIFTKDKRAVVMDIFSPPRPEYREEGEGFGSNEMS